MNQLTIFLFGLAFLLFFSYRDLKYSKVENHFILVYFSCSIVIFLLMGNLIIQIFFIVFWILLGGLLWNLNNIGGADFKILIINSVYLSLIVPNAFAGQFLFIILFGIFGVLYGIMAKIIKTKIEIPFVPIITLTYIISYIFWIV